MQNIRLSINLLQVKGARTIRMNNANGQPELYVAIPVSQLFVPQDKPEPRLMLTAIHTPNALYGNFMIKPYLSAADYKTLSREEQQNLPIVGKGTFIEPSTNKELAQAAETVDVVDATIPTPTSQPTSNPGQASSTQPTSGPAAPLASAPSPSAARPTAANSPAAQPRPEFFVVNGNNNSLHQCDNFNDAAAFASGNFEAVAIEAWNGNTRVGRWTYDVANFSWNQVC